MAILAYTSYSNVPTPQDWLNYLKLFLQNQGWTIGPHRENVYWANQGGGVYNFSPGNEHYLDVTSTGFGNQTIHVRFRIYGSPSNNYRTIAVNLGFGNTGVDTSSATNPDIRFYNPATTLYVDSPYAPSSQWDMVSNLLLPKMHLFGYEQKWACVVSEIDAYRCIFVQFGTLEMLDLNSDYGAFTVGRGAESIYNTHDSPFDMQNFLSYDKPVAHTGGASSTDNAFSYYRYGTDSVHSLDFSDGAFYAAQAWFSPPSSNYEVRPMSRRLHYAKDPSVGIWYYTGREWCYHMYVKGMRIGERFKLGTEEYITFPGNKVDNSYTGFAFRVA